MSGEAHSISVTEYGDWACTCGADGQHLRQMLDHVEPPQRGEPLSVRITQLVGPGTPPSDVPLPLRAQPPAGAESPAGDRSRRPAGGDGPDRWSRRTVALPLTQNPSGPSLALIGPEPDGTYSLHLPGTLAQGLDRELLTTQLALLVLRLDTGLDTTEAGTP